MPSQKDEERLLSRRALLKSMGLAPLLLRPAPFYGSSALYPMIPAHLDSSLEFPFADVRLTPHYPTKSPLVDVLRLVAPGSDEYVTEKYAAEIEVIFRLWSQALRGSTRDHSGLANALHPQLQGCRLTGGKETILRSGNGIDVVRKHFAQDAVPGRDNFLHEIDEWLNMVGRVETAEFEINGLKVVSSDPVRLGVEIRYDLVSTRKDSRREERVGSWRTEWTGEQSSGWIARTWQAGEEKICVAKGPVFIDVTGQAMGKTESYTKQMLHGADYWRTVLDGAIGVDVYGNNGLAAGDYNNDGFDDLYVCQGAGLPNRLYRNQGDGTFQDVTEMAGVGVLDNTACALFADFNNNGLQDLLVVCGTGPLLFINKGDGTFSLKRDAFQFERPPQGTFTHAAVADYDGDGRLDIYFCMYMYYLGLDQYHYPVPYFDARNGPPNCLLHNQGNSSFVEKTQATGLNIDNDRYSFACAWGNSTSTGLPDLFVANDFGSSQLYRNRGDGTFKVVSTEAHIEEVGAGMSCSWADVDNDGHQDLYVTSMWEAAGQRVAEQQRFHENAPAGIRGLYQRHARGNALYRNQGDGTFKNVAREAGVEMGRWSWSADFWDFDHDGYADLYVANGYISAPDRSDLASFFWRQVVGKSPEDATPALAYEHGWNAINELIRSDASWNSYARNVMFANNRDGTFCEASGPVGLDFLEDSRSFVLADLDHDGRLEVILKNRNAPQLRILHNSMLELGQSLSFRLRGHASNRDAIGAAVVVEAGSLSQTKYLQAGTGFLAQHSKELFFGIGKFQGTINATVRWPSGLKQAFQNVPVNHRIDIEEGSATFTAKEFASTPYALPGAPPGLDVLPLDVETWLIDPLKAPEFALADLSGNQRILKSFQGGLVLLNIWQTTAPLCLEQLRLMHRHRSELARAQLEVLAMNVDDASGLAAAQSWAARESLSFPILFASEEVAGIYNIVYRYMFDRRRDLALPTSFLIDQEGMIVKVYQGKLDVAHVIEDARSLPATAADRMRKATPFHGTLYQGAFQRNDFTYGVAMFRHGYLQQAAESFEHVIASKPDDPEGYYNLGTLSLRRNDLAQARHYLEQTVKLRPNYPEAWNNLGMIAAQERQPDEAIQNFQHSLLLRPGYAIALLNLGNVYRRQGAFSKAQASLDRAAELQPDDAEIAYSLGMLYVQQNQVERASDYLRKAVALRPDYPEALNNLGVLFVRTQDYSTAEEQFKTCIRLVPNFDQSYLNLARLYAMRSDKGKATEILQELLRLQPQNAGATQALEMLR